MRAVILVHDEFGVWTSKTATSLLRYGRSYDVRAIIDRSKAGDDAGHHVGEIGDGIPMVGSVDEALAFGPEVLVIGVAPVGGRLPADWRPEILTALRAGVSVLSGLHSFLADDAEFASAAAHGNATITDFRRVTRPPRVASGQGRSVSVPVVHTVGTDCSSGKMTTAMELVTLAKEQGIDAAFVATGQTGLMIGCDAGAPIDRVVSDFVAGAAEELVLECAAKGKQLIVVEGQGAPTHPAYSGVTVGLLHGSFPDLVILCHQEGRRHHGEYATKQPFRLATLAATRQLVEALLAPVTGGRVVAVSLATHGLDDEAARAAIDRVAADTGLPVTDPVRFGAQPLLDAVVHASNSLPNKEVLRPRASVPLKPNSV